MSEKKGHTPRPLNEHGKLDRDQIKLEFMAAETTSFQKFCRDKGYNIKTMRATMPYHDWAREKLEIMTQQRLEDLGDKLFDQRSALPAAMIEGMTEGIALAKLARVALRNKLVAIVKKQQEDPDFAVSQDPHELVAVTNAVGSIIKATKEATYMQQISIKFGEELLPKTVTELAEQPFAEQTSIAEAKAEQGTWKVRLIGVENPEGKTAAEFDAMIGVDSDGVSRSENDE